MKRFGLFACSLLFSLLLLSGCHHVNHADDSCFYEFDEKGPAPLVEYSFFPFKNGRIDSVAIKKYDLALVVRFNDKCQLKQLPLSIETSSFNRDEISKSKIVIDLFDNNNNSLGKGNFGLYECEIPLAENIDFDEGLCLSIETSQPYVAGVLALGIVRYSHDINK